MLPSASRAFAVLLLGTLAAGCGGGDRPPTPTDTPTSGGIRIAVDESFRPLMQAQINVFMGLFQQTEIMPLWTPEDQAIRDLIDDKVRLAVASRELNQAERAAFEQQKIIPRMVKIAEDGVALILNRANPDSLLTMPQLNDIFHGRIRTWNELGGGGSGEEILVVFDGNGSSNFNFLIEQFDLETIEGLQVFAAKSSEEVIAYVQANEQAIGVIGVGWISDFDDPEQQAFLGTVTVASVAEAANAPADEHYQPYQAYLALQQYPLRRQVIIHSREARQGLGSGFMNHVAGERGQRVVLKSGLLPATMPVRIVGLKETF